MATATDNMISFIRDVLDKHGGRIAGSPAEHAAQQDFANQLKALTDNVKQQPFEAALHAKFKSLGIIFGVYYVALGLFPFSTHAAFLIANLASFLLMMHFVRSNGILDFLFRKQQSSNVVGTLEPSGEVKQTVVIAGHMDCVYEFRWWYHFKSVGAIMNVLSVLMVRLFAILTTLLFIYNMVLLIYPDLGKLEITPIVNDVAIAIWWGLAFGSPLTLSFVFMRSRRVVDGASDNLSGVAITYQAGLHFTDPGQPGRSTLSNTRIKLVSFGSEETGLKGSKAFAETFGEELKAENAFLINIDTIRLPEQVSIVTKEASTMVKFDKGLVAGLAATFEQENIPVKQVKLKIGGTDAASFIYHHIPAVSIIGLSHNRLDPCYHTRLDTLENINPVALENVFNGVVAYIRESDRKIAGEQAV